MARGRVPLDEFLRDPMATLRRARESGPLADMSFAVGVLRHADVRALFSDERLTANFPEFLRSFGVSSGPFYEWMSTSPLNMDGAQHLAWRSVMSKTFTPRRVESIRPFLARESHALIDGFAARGSCDFVAEFAEKLPALGLCELIGVPHEDRERFRGWADTIGLGFSPVSVGPRIADIDRALEQLLRYTGELSAQRKAEPKDDLVSKVALAAGEAGWTEEQVRGSIAGLVFAGYETTKNQLGWMIAVLSERADLWDALARREQAISPVVEEVLRLRPAVTGVGRQVHATVERDGDRLEPGRALLSIWSANHDESVYPRPDDLDPVKNADQPHLAFGFGAHRCLGAALARAELEEALSALTKRITCPTLEPGSVWRPPVGINGPVKLPIAFRSAS